MARRVRRVVAVREMKTWSMVGHNTIAAINENNINAALLQHSAAQHNKTAAFDVIVGGTNNNNNNNENANDTQRLHLYYTIHMR